MVDSVTYYKWKILNYVDLAITLGCTVFSSFVHDSHKIFKIFKIFSKINFKILFWPPLFIFYVFILLTKMYYIIQLFIISFFFGLLRSCTTDFLTEKVSNFLDPNLIYILILWFNFKCTNFILTIIRTNFNTSKSIQ